MNDGRRFPLRAGEDYVDEVLGGRYHCYLLEVVMTHSSLLLATN